MKKLLLIALLPPIFLLFTGVSFADFKAKMLPGNFYIAGAASTDCYEVHYGDSCINVAPCPNGDTSGCSGGCGDTASLTVSDNKKLKLDFYSDGSYIGTPVNSNLKVIKLGNGQKVVTYYKNNNQGLQGWEWDDSGNMYFNGKPSSGPIPLHPLAH